MTTRLTLEKKIIRENYLVLSGISWSKFKQIEAVFSDISRIRLIYLDGTLEIMTLSPEHEGIKGTIRVLMNKLELYKKNRYSCSLVLARRVLQVYHLEEGYNRVEYNQLLPELDLQYYG